MKSFIIPISIFLYSFTLIATDEDAVDSNYSLPSELSKSSISKASNETEIDFSKIDFDGDDDEDLALTTNIASRKRYYRTKKYNRPYKISDSAIIIKNGKKEIDRDKYNQIKIDGLKQIAKCERKNSRRSSYAISKILLTNPIPSVRSEAAAALGRMRRGLSALHRAIRTDGYEVRFVAYKSIEQIGSRSSLKYFIYGIHAKDPRIVISSYHGLGKTRTRYGRKLILKHGLKSNNPTVVAAALDSLGYYGYYSDLKLFEKYIASSTIEHRAGAIRGLGNHRSSASLDILVDTFDKNKSLEADIIFAVAKKRTLSATLVLLKIMNATRNENYKAVIERELLYRKAFGRYAIVQFKVATIRKYPRPRSKMVTRLREKDVARIKKVTYKRYKARLNGKIEEDRYYLLQAVRREGKYRGRIVNGWIFGPKIKVITIRNPNSTYATKNKQKSENPFKNFKEVPSEEESIGGSGKRVNNSLIETGLNEEGSVPKFTNEKIENDQDEDVFDE